MKYWCSPPRRRADHEDQDVVLFNRAMLPAYYGILRMCCQQSRTFTRQLAQHQNMQWAFKNITPYPAQYTAVRPLLYTHSFLTHSPPSRQWYVLFCTCTPFSHIPCPIHCGMSSLIHVLLSHTFPAQYTAVRPLLYTYSFLTHSLPNTLWDVLSCTHTPFSHIPCPVDSGTSSLIHVLLSHYPPSTAVRPLLYTNLFHAFPTQYIMLGCLPLWIFSNHYWNWSQITALWKLLLYYGNETTKNYTHQRPAKLVNNVLTSSYPVVSA